MGFHFTSPAVKIYVNRNFFMVEQNFLSGLKETPSKCQCKKAVKSARAAKFLFIFFTSCFRTRWSKRLGCFILIWLFNSSCKIYMSNSHQVNKIKLILYLDSPFIHLIFEIHPFPGYPLSVQITSCKSQFLKGTHQLSKKSGEISNNLNAAIKICHS